MKLLTIGDLFFSDRCVAVIPAKSLESGLNFREANPLLCSSNVKGESMVETCRVAIQGIKKSRVGEGWLGRTKKKKKKAGRILSSARRARIMSI